MRSPYWQTGRVASRLIRLLGPLSWLATQLQSIEVYYSPFSGVVHFFYPVGYIADLLYYHMWTMPWRMQLLCLS